MKFALEKIGCKNACTGGAQLQRAYDSLKTIAGQVAIQLLIDV